MIWRPLNHPLTSLRWRTGLLPASSRHKELNWRTWRRPWHDARQGNTEFAKSAERRSTFPASTHCPMPPGAFAVNERLSARPRTRPRPTGSDATDLLAAGRFSGSCSDFQYSHYIRMIFANCRCLKHANWCVYNAAGVDHNLKDRLQCLPKRYDARPSALILILLPRTSKRSAR